MKRQEWTNAVRTFHPDDPKFSYWGYMWHRWPRYAGLRLDVLLLEYALRSEACWRWRRSFGEGGRQGHAPVWAASITGPVKIHSESGTRLQTSREILASELPETYRLRPARHEGFKLAF